MKEKKNSFFWLVCAGVLLHAPGIRAQEPSVTKVSVDRARELLEKAVRADPWQQVPDGSSLAWSESYLLHTLVSLYEATGDSRYLHTLASRGDRLLARRDDRRGVADGSGHQRPAWSMALKYVVASGRLADRSGREVITIRSTPSAFNNLTKVSVIPGKGKDVSRFSLRVSNDQFKRYEEFTDLSMDPADERYVEKVVNDPLSPYSARSGNYTDTRSNLIRMKVENTGTLPAAQQVALSPIPLAYMGYLGVVYDPIMRFAEIVKGDARLAELLPAANRFIQAAEESYQDAAARLWRNGPNEGEGYYLTCERGESFPADNVGQPFNFLAKHVCVELALYRLTGKKAYLDRSEKIVNLFKNRLVYQPEGDLYTWNYWYEPMTTTGWTAKDSLSSNVGFFPGAARVEDVSHAALNVSMTVAAHRMGIGFDETDMKRFSNTLLKNVLTPERDGNRRTVDGKGAYPAYFNALHRWLDLSAVNPEVYHAIRETYLNRDEESLHFTANLLRWERILKKSRLTERNK